ncbi:MAG: polysaccharide deacetylase family protein [Acidiferrobacterales bacterium]
MRPIASLSLDLDNKWSYLKTHGDPGWEAFPSYLDLVVPRILPFLDQRRLKITFFIVGQDAALEKNHKALHAIAAAGHEIGNHSFNHDPWLHLYSEEELDTELAKAEECIEMATGQRPIGFRGPGFSISPTALRVLRRRGYEYDATAFPNLLNPLARAYFFMTSNLSQEEKRRRKALFGTLGDAFRPVKPYYWRIESETLTEIPVTTMPLFRLPIHFSYLLYLSTFSSSLARSYFRTALALCRWTNTRPSLLLHPLDFMGADDDRDLAFFPAMKLPSEQKIALVGEVLELLSAHYTVSTMQQHAREIASVPELPRFELGS